MKRKVGKLPQWGEVFGMIRRIEYWHVDDEPGTIRVHDFREQNVELVRVTDRAVVIQGDSELVADYG